MFKTKQLSFATFGSVTITLPKTLNSFRNGTSSTIDDL